VTEFSDIPEDPYDFQNVPRYRGGNRVTRNKLNPKPGKLPVMRAGGAVASHAAAAGNDGGYWNLVVGACLLLWVLYVVAHNEVQTWANILFWSPAPAVQVTPATGGSAAGSGAAAGTANTIGTLGALGGSQSSALGLGSLFGTLSGGLQGGALSTPGIIQSIPGAVTGAGGGLATPATPSGSGAGGMLGSGFWNGGVGSMLKRFGFGK
jgi:hypothetical protein